MEMAFSMTFSPEAISWSTLPVRWRSSQASNPRARAAQGLSVPLPPNTPALVASARVVGWWSLVVLALFAIVGRPALERAVFTQIDSQDRVSLYVQVIDLIRQQPLTGVGLDVFETAFQGVHRTPMSPDLAWDRAHSTYLALWAEMGLIVGSIPPLICLIIAVTLITRFMRAKRDFVFVAIALSAITLGAIHSLVDFSLEIAANVYVFLALVALGATRATGQGAGERS